MPPARPTIPRLALAAGGLAAALTIVASGCFYTDAGLSPPTEGLYFPSGILVSPGRTALYVANSDFDLQYNGGTVQALDLAGLRATLGTLLKDIRGEIQCSGDATTCAAAGLPGNTITSACSSIPVSRGVGATGAACQTASDCQSGLCVNGACQPCGSGADCPGGRDPTCPGQCAAGVCMLTCNGNQILTPSPCSPVAPPFAKVGTVGAFASGVVLTHDPTGGKARLFVPVRGDPSITWFDVIDDKASAASSTCAAFGSACRADADCCTGACDTGSGTCTIRLSCGQSGADQRCDDAHRIGVDPYDNLRDLILPVEPVGLDVSGDGQDIVSVHNIIGAPAIGLSLNPWNGTPSFAYYASGTTVPAGPSDVAHVPEPKLVTVSRGDPSPIDYQQGFVVSFNASPEVDIFQVYPDQYSNPPRPFVQRSFQVGVTVNADGKDSRGIAIDGSARAACEAGCSPADPTAYRACLRGCLATPLRLFIANRAPPSLLLGQVVTTLVESTTPPVTGCLPVGDACSAPGDCCAGICQGGRCSGPAGGPGAYDTVQIYGQTPLSVGPSKVALGKAILPDGVTTKTYVFTVSFDSRFVFMYDPDAARIVQAIRTGRGPHAIAFDSCTQDCGPGGPYAYLYVGHFTDSYLGVVDLDMSHPETFGTMFASIGEPLPPLETQ